MKRLTLIALSALVALACSKTETEPAKPKDTVAAPAATQEEPQAQVATAGAPDTEVPEDQFPTPQDYEEEAEKKLTAANLDLELDQLEEEIGD